MKKGRIILAVLIISLLAGACGAAYEFAPAAEAPAPAEEAPAPIREAPAPAFDAAPESAPAAAEDFDLMEDSMPFDDFDFDFAPEAPVMEAAEMEPELETPAAAPPQAPSVASESPQAQDNEPATEIPILTPSATDRKLIYTVNLDLQTTDFMAGMRILRETTGAMGGYVVSENVYGRDIHTPEVERTLTLLYRVPSEQLANFLVVVEDNFNLLSLRLWTDEATVEYRIAENQLENLREQERRILEALDAADIEVSDIAELESTLTDVQRSISELIAVQAIIDDGVIFSTIMINMFEAVIVEIEDEEEEEEVEEIIPVTFGERLNDALARSGGVLASFGQGLLLVIIAIMPVLIILAFIAALILAIIVPIRKRRKKAAANKPYPAPIPAPTPNHTPYHNPMDNQGHQNGG